MSATTCPQCARPVAAARPRCVYCGADLPSEAVAAATAARAALETEWARQGAALAGTGTPAEPRPEARADTRPAGPPRVLLVIGMEGVDAGTLAGALSLSPLEADQKLRRGGPDLHRILPGPEAAAEAARLRGHGLPVLELPEDEVRRAEPVRVTRGGPAPDGLVLHGEEGAIPVSAKDVLLVVRGAIVREYQSSLDRRRPRVATLEPGYRAHLHRWSDPRPVELDPAAFDFGPGGAEGGAQLQITAWIDAAFPQAPRDDSFRLVIPALAPALAAAGGPAAAAEALARPRGPGSTVLDNLAQFRFHSAWRGTAQRRRAR